MSAIQTQVTEVVFPDFEKEPEIAPVPISSVVDEDEKKEDDGEVVEGRAIDTETEDVIPVGNCKCNGYRTYEEFKNEVEKEIYEEVDRKIALILARNLYETYDGTLEQFLEEAHTEGNTLSDKVLYLIEREDIEEETPEEDRYDSWAYLGVGNVVRIGSGAGGSGEFPIVDAPELESLIVTIGEDQFLVKRDKIEAPTAPTVTESGAFVKTATVYFSTTIPEAVVRYTMGEGEEPEAPTPTTGQIGTSLTLNQSENAPYRTVYIKAITAKFGLASEVVSREYTIHSKVANVVLGTPSGNNYSESRTLSVACATAGAKIKYTLDGSDPKNSPTAIEIDSNTGSITINRAGTTTIKAFAYKTDWVDGEIATTSVTARQIQAVSISASGNNYSATRAITLSCASSGVEIHYTTNGSTPSASSPLYDAANKPVLSATATVKAIAIRTGWTDSAVASASITVGKPAMHYGYAGATIDVPGIEALAGYKETSSPAGEYTSTTAVNAYLWICIDPAQTIHTVKSSGFDVPMDNPVTIGKYKCYRSAVQHAAGTITYTIA